MLEPDQEPAGTDEPVAIICGGGSLPFAVADAVLRRGRRAVLFPIRGFGDRAAVERYPHHWIALGQFGRLCRLAAAERCREMVFIGHLIRPSLHEIRLDWQTLRLMPRIVRLYRGGDDRLLSGIGSMFEERGFRLLGAHEVAPEILVPEGLIGNREPSERDRADIATGLAVLAAMGPFDIGQAAVVASGHVVAVEAAEGTDAMLARVAELRRLGRIRYPVGVGVLVKAPKPGQDRRFDLPSIGPQTAAGVIRAGLAGLAVVAGESIMAEPQVVAGAADRGKIFVVGIADPQRP
jgi:UDP-2,3-diacylglucosamine hydrolase